MPVRTRRQFVATTSRAVAAGLMAGPGLRLKILPSLGSRSANEFLPEQRRAADELQKFATTAIDAARQAGASFADVRIADRFTLEVQGGYYATVPSALLEGFFTYGVRVLVDGAWAFVHGSERSADAVAASARNAVTTARGYSKLLTERVELPPLAAVTGEWTIPVKRDPFAIPLQEQAALTGAFDEAHMRVRDTEGMSGELHWTRETRIFASTEGALVTQYLNRAAPEVVAVSGKYVEYWGDQLRFPGVVPQSGGYEVLNESSFQDAIKALAERTVQYARLPAGTLNVGRYPVVMEGGTLGMVFARTIGAAAELDRVLGYDADASGTSFMTPTSAFLGAEIASPVLSVTAHRDLPSITAVKWDDEGVEPHPFPLVKDGHFMNYVTSRDTAGALGSGGRPLGCVVAPNAGDLPLIRAPHLSIAPAKTTASFEDLCREVDHGVLVLDNRDAFGTDQQLATGMLNFFERDWLRQDGLMLEIVKGKPVRRLSGNGVRFKSNQFWKSITAVGDASTVINGAVQVEKDMPWVDWLQGTTAPAMAFKNVDIVSLDRYA